MGRNSTREVVGKVASALRPTPKSITEISEETGVDRKSVTRYLEALTNHEYIEEITKENWRTRKFRIAAKGLDPVESIPAWKYFERVEDAKIAYLKEKPTEEVEE